MNIVLNDMVRSHYSSSAISNHGRKVPRLLKSLKQSTLRCSSITYRGIGGQLIVKPNVIC